jgi:hypothetical protein
MDKENRVLTNEKKNTWLPNSQSVSVTMEIAI